MMPDGKRFLVKLPIMQDSPPITVVLSTLAEHAEAVGPETASDRGGCSPRSGHCNGWSRPSLPATRTPGGSIETRTLNQREDDGVAASLELRRSG